MELLYLLTILLWEVVQLAKKPKPTSKERRRQQEVRRQQQEARRLRLIDNHHILFDRSLWDVGCHQELRRDLDMIVTMDRRIHDELHRRVPPIPPLGSGLTMRVVSYYRELQCSAKREMMGGENNPVVGIALLKLALDQVVKRGKVTELEVRQIELMEDNLDEQVEFILRSDAWIKQHYAADVGMTCDAGPTSLVTTDNRCLAEPEEELEDIIGPGAFS